MGQWMWEDMNLLYGDSIRWYYVMSCCPHDTIPYTWAKSSVSLLVEFLIALLIAEILNASRYTTSQDRYLLKEFLLYYPVHQRLDGPAG